MGGKGRGGEEKGRGKLRPLSQIPGSAPVMRSDSAVAIGKVARICSKSE